MLRAQAPQGEAARLRGDGGSLGRIRWASLPTAAFSMSNTIMTPSNEGERHTCHRKCHVAHPSGDNRGKRKSGRQ